RLQEWKLNFGGVLGTMGASIFFEEREAVPQFLSKLVINIYWPERSLPETFAHDRKGMAYAGVVRAHQDAARWYFQFGENCAGNVARVHITGVGNYAAERGGRRLAWREIGLDVREQSCGISWVEAPGTRRLAMRRASVRRTTVECTVGGGEKAPGGKVNKLSTRA